MKYIHKRGRPRALHSWVRSNIGLPGVQYGTHGFPKAAVQRALIEEQGSICAYTMIRIDANESHVEHLKPQAASHSEGRLDETFDYHNMVACYPGPPQSGDVKVTFGAIRRGSTWDPKNFLTPVTESCELRIRYHADGQARPRRSSDTAAAWTIGVLNLNDARLMELRRASIEGWGLSLTAQEPLSPAAAKRTIPMLDRRDRAGMLEPFCVALRHAAVEYVALLGRAATRAKHARGGKRKHLRR